MGGAFRPQGTSVEEDAATSRGGEPPLSLCIVNFNGAAFLRPTLEAALADGESFGEILFVDNGSDDGSLGIAAEYDGIRVVALGENRGASAVRNAAIRRAASDLILLIDSDVRLADGCAGALAAALGERDAAIAMPRVLYEADPDTVQYDGAEWHFLGLQIIRHPDSAHRPDVGDIREIGSVITACCLIDRRKVGREPFDEDFFIYLEDHDFGVRARLQGFEILSVPGACCYHGEGTPGLSIRALGSYSSRRVFCLIRNRWQFMAKNYEARTLLMLAPLLAFYETAQLGIVLRNGWFREWVRAVGWMGRNAPRVLRRRRELQGIRRCSDRELMKAGDIPFRNDLTSGPLERRALAVLNTVAATYWRYAGPLV